MPGDTEGLGVRPERILELVDDEQRQAVIAGPHPLLVVAGAGTGKTRTLTCRVAYRVSTGQVPAGSVLAVTHSTRAAGEMRDRFRRMGVDQLDQVAARTIHAAALRQLRYFWQATGRAGDLFVAEDRYAVLRAGLAQLGVRNADGPLVADLLGEIEWAKTQLIAPDGYEAEAQAAGRRISVDHAKTAAAYSAYSGQLTRHGALDFTDLLTEAAAVIENNDTVAEEIRSRYRTLCVDEYQDVDPAQQRLIDAWLGSGSDLTVVGDPRQAIYAFKGADPQLLSTFPERYPTACVVTLTKDYRSTPQVVTVANALAAAADPEPGTKPRSKVAKAVWMATHPAPLHGMRPDGPTAVVREVEDEEAEARWVAAQIGAALRAGTAPAQVAILVRYNAQTAPFEQALTSAGIAYQMADGTRFFDRDEIRRVVEEMRRRLASAWTRGASFDPDEVDGGGADQLTGTSLLREVLADYGFDRARPPEGAGATRDRWEALRALLDLVEGLPGAELIGAPELLADLDARRAEAHQVTTRAITIATIHKAKGLEWDMVFCPRWTEGSLPISFARSESDIGEERRLAYVAVTRARRALTISHARTRSVGQAREVRKVPATPSRFLADAGLIIVDGQIRSSAPQPKASRRSGASARSTSAVRSGARTSAEEVTRCARCGTPLTDDSAVKLGRCATHLTGEDGRRWTALREWRTDMSRLDSIPPYRVLSDATVMALVAEAPRTSQELSTIKGIGPSKLARYGSEILGLLHRTTK